VSGAKRTSIAVFAGLLLCVGMLMNVVTADAAAGSHSEMLLFDGGGSERLNGVTYHSFRIPSLVRTTSNTLLAFAEGRQSSNADYGNINLVYKRSTNNGTTWSALREVVGKGTGTWGNPTAVVDSSTKKIWLFMSWNPTGYSQGGTDGTTKITKWDQRKVYVTSSSDDGLTWATPVDLTSSLKPKTLANGSTWAWDAIGPGVGIQTTAGAHPGRLVIPALYRTIYSDNHGATWKVQRLLDKSGKIQEGTTESTVLELANGDLYRNDRATKANWDKHARRWAYRGTIEGGFTAAAADLTLLDPRAEGSVLRYKTDTGNRIEFLNSASTKTRTKMTVRISYNEASTWRFSRSLNDAPLPKHTASGWSGLGSGAVAEGGYSCMAKTADGYTAALVEVNENTKSDSSHESIVFRKFNLAWILNGRSE
jgi:sialidase-1